MNPQVLVLTGFGINCDHETEFVFNHPAVGGQAQRVHLNDLLEGRCALRDFHLLALPGGFSFGDDIASGKVLANLLKARLKTQLEEHLAARRPIIGICNGFQVLIKMGLLPAWGGCYGQQQATLTVNDSGRFEDRWVTLKVPPKCRCVWTRGLEQLYLPVRHGEGKFLPGAELPVEELFAAGQVAVQYAAADGGPAPGYPANPNGSVRDIAGLCDPTGLVLGLMPHPEAFWHRTHHPRWTREELPEEGQGLALFRNAVEFVKQS